MKNNLPVNQKEQIIYTVLMVFVMCSVMTFYNSAWHTGLTLDTLKNAWLIFPLTATIAFLVEWFIVGRIAHMLIYRFIRPTDPLPKKILLSAFFFVTQMVLWMSIICAILFNFGSEHFWSELAITIPRNFMMAYPLQVIIAGPLVGIIFRKLFPIGTIIIPQQVK